MTISGLTLWLVLLLAGVGGVAIIVAALAFTVAQVKFLRVRMRQDFHSRMVVAATNALALAEQEAKQHDDVDVRARALVLVKFFAGDLLPKAPKMFGFNPAALDTWLEAFLAPAPRQPAQPPPRVAPPPKPKTPAAAPAAEPVTEAKAS